MPPTSRLCRFIWSGLARLALLSYPRSHRRRYRAELSDVALERSRALQSERGALAGVAWLFSELAMFVVTAFRVRADERDERNYAALSSAPSTVRDRRSSRREISMEVFLYQVRSAARSLARSPGLTATGVATLAIGIGANVAIFSLVYAVLLRPLPLHDPERLVALWETNPERGWTQAQVSSANYLDWREQTESFSGIAAYDEWLSNRALLLDGEPLSVRTNTVTGNFFEVLGVEAALGRTFDDSVTWLSSPGDSAIPPVVLSHAFWLHTFGGDPSVAGRTLLLGNAPHRVVGIMPPTFRYPFRDTELWLPTRWDPAVREQVWFRRAHGMRAIGRLAPGVSLGQATTELATVAKRLEHEYPETNTQMGNGAGPLRDWVLGDARRPILVLSVAVALLLLIACANVANMLLAKATGRRTERAIRQALGASRSHLVLQSLLESSMIALLGGIASLLLGFWTIDTLLALRPDVLPRLDGVRLNGQVVLFTFGLSLVTSLLFGGLPAWRAGSEAPGASPTRSATPSAKAQRAIRLLVAAEVALALPLAVGAGLTAKSLWRLAQVEPGFTAGATLIGKVSLPAATYDTQEKVSAFYRQLVEEMGAISGVESVALSSRLPFGNQRWSSDFVADGWQAGTYGVGVRHDEVSPGLFATMGVSLLAGRDFHPSDKIDSEPVVIINRALADRYFGDEDPLGRRVAFDREVGPNSHWMTIVGVVSNVRRESLALDEKPSFYAPILQDTTRSAHLLLRTKANPLSFVSAVRDRLAVVDPGLPLADISTLERQTYKATGQQRFLVALLSTFAGFSLLLAAIGIFGVVSYSTRRGTREIGIRVALGAAKIAVFCHVLWRGMLPVVSGMCVGLVAAALLVRSMASLLFEVRPFDGTTFVGVTCVLGLVALLACVLPARWASRVDPATTLRAD